MKWTENEIKRLRKMRDSNASNGEIARALGRSTSSVNGMATKLKLKRVGRAKIPVAVHCDMPFGSSSSS